MDKLEGRFLVYDGFQQDAPEIFKNLIEKFNFKIKNLSVYGLTFINNRCELNLFYETGVQLWLKVPKYNVTEMISILSVFKGEKVYQEYRSVRRVENIKQELIGINDFLCTYFVDELKEN